MIDQKQIQKQNITDFKQISLNSNVEIFKDLFKVFKDLNDSVVLDINKDRLKLYCMNYQHILYCEGIIKKEYFNTFIFKNESIKFIVDPKTFYNSIKDFKKVDINLNFDENKIYLKFNNGFNSQIDLLNKDDQIHNIIDFDLNTLDHLTTKIKICSKTFKDSLKILSKNNNKISFELNNFDKNFILKSKTNNNTQQKNFNFDEIQILKDYENKSKYDYEFLKHTVKVLFDDEFILNFGYEYPLLIEQNLKDIKINFVISPIIEND